MPHDPASVCRTCRSPNPAGAKFCAECGAKLPPSPPGSPNGRLEEHSLAERRQLTLLFCDLVGSTQLAAQIDPEELSKILRAYQSVVAVVMQRAGGFIARYTGDGVLVYFGWPRADEADAEQAVRAGLAVVEAVGKITAVDRPLQVRIGIATGLVVVGDLVAEGAAYEHVVVGEAPNLAARLQTLAQPGMVVIDKTTRIRIGEFFECRSLGEHAVKGYGQPFEAWQVAGSNTIESRFQALRASRLSPFINREDELGLLQRSWSDAKQSGGRVVLVAGEPGIGKSRLIAAFEDRVLGDHYSRLHLFCTPHHRDDALHPVIAAIEHVAGFKREDDAPTKARKLEALIASSGASRYNLTLLAELLSVPLEAPVVLNLTPTRRKERLFEALLDQIERFAQRQRLFLVFEDVQWSDPSSLELFGLLIERIRQIPVLLVATFRSDWRPPWSDRAGVSLMTVGRLGRTHSTALIQQLVGRAVILGEMMGRIAEGTDGVPLFIEELTKAVSEDLAQQGSEQSGSTAPLVVPGTLQASLMARLDRLPAGKEIAQIGAVIGRDFSHLLLSDIAGMPQAQLSSGLEQLVTAELLFQSGMPPNAHYTFKHALVQDTAYESLLRTKRAAIHGRLVQVLLERAPDMPETQPGLLGHHCVQAGLIQQAAAYYKRAGERSAERAALAETRSYLERGLGLVRSLPDTTARRVLEVELKLALGRVLLSTKGSADIEGGRVFEDAVGLCRGLDHPELLTRALWGAWFNRAHRREPANDEGLAHELLSLGLRQDNSAAQIVAQTMLGVTHLWQGRFSEGRSNLESALELCGSGAHKTLDLAIVSNHIDDHARMQLSLTQTCLGHFEQAAANCERGLRNVLAAPHLPLRAIVLGVKCRHDAFIRDYAALQDTAGALVRLAQEQGFPFYLAVGRCHLGWLAARAGDSEGIALLQSGLDALQSSDAAIWEPYFRGMMAEAQAQAGNIVEAERMLQQALAISTRTGGVWFDAELHRLEGEFALMRPTPDQPAAEAAFQQSIASARRRSARLWELRAATSLARLWSLQGKHALARQLLEPVHAWFSGDTETTDVTAAAALLATLA